MTFKDIFPGLSRSWNFQEKKPGHSRRHGNPDVNITAAFVVDRVEIFLTSSLITRQNLAAISHTSCVHVAGPKNFTGRWDPATLEMGCG